MICFIAIIQILDVKYGQFIIQKGVERNYSTFFFFFNKGLKPVITKFLNDFYFISVFIFCLKTRR